MIHQAITDLASTVQPLVFRTEWNEAPYWIQGTVFLVGFNNRAFVVTARHCVTKEQESVMPLCVFPNDKSSQCMPLSDGVFVPAEKYKDEIGDLAIIEIDKSKLDAETVEANIIDLNKSNGEWLSAASNSRFIVVGYPDHYSEINNERKAIRHQRIILEGKYAGQSTHTLLHALELIGESGFSSLSGFSGSPVFALIENEPNHFTVVFCGVASLGTTEEQPQHRLNFVDREFLMLALNSWCKSVP